MNALNTAEISLARNITSEDKTEKGLEEISKLNIRKDDIAGVVMEVVWPTYSVSTKAGRMARRLLLKWETLFLQEDNKTVSLNIT